MKKSLLVFVLLLISAGNAFCFSSLNLSVYDGRNIYILFDNVSYNTPAAEINIDQITGEKHYIKVFSDNNSPALNNVIFSDYVFIPDGYRVFAVIDDYGKFSIYKKVVFTISTHFGAKCTCSCECCKNCPVCNPVKPNETDECKYKVMKDESFTSLKNTVSSKSFENTKKDIITSAIDENYFTSLQIKELISLLTFENTRIEAAKYSYKKICDRQNFSIIYDAFQFESSVNFMTEWLKSNK